MRRKFESETESIAGSCDPRRSLARQEWGKLRGGLPDAWLARKWNSVDRLYVWSAVAGLAAALVMIVLSEYVR